MENKKTLGELIELCGGGFQSLFRDTNKGKLNCWIAEEKFLEWGENSGAKGIGSTPELAVKRLLQNLIKQNGTGK
jgi:hypothetical protein